MPLPPRQLSPSRRRRRRRPRSSSSSSVPLAKWSAATRLSPSTAWLWPVKLNGEEGKENVVGVVTGLTPLHLFVQTIGKTLREVEELISGASVCYS